MVRESHGGAGQGVTLIRVVVRATERGKSSAGTSGNVRTASEARVWRGTSAYRRSPRARARYGRSVGWAGLPPEAATMG